MDLREWALIIFTILAQMSVGAFCVLGVVHVYALRKYGAEEADRLADRSLLAIGVVLVLGFLASFLHLGNPLNAPRAIVNFGSSWLSREILFGVLFALSGALFALLQWRKIGSFAVRNVVAWIAALFGLGLVFCMSRVYMLETQPAWNNWATPVQFYVTTFLMGTLAIGAAYIASYTTLQRQNIPNLTMQLALLREVIRGIAVASMALLGAELILVPVQIAYLASQGEPASLTAALMYDQYGLLLIIRLGLVFIGAGVFSFFLYRNAQSEGGERVLGTLAYSAFALVLIAEVIGRFIFYSTHIKIGL
jgi:anaerobic dimethyl sulfoxide reductase subunit C (anchor subunit)